MKNKVKSILFNVFNSLPFTSDVSPHAASIIKAADAIQVAVNEAIQNAVTNTYRFTDVLPTDATDANKPAAPESAKTAAATIQRRNIILQTVITDAHRRTAVPTEPTLSQHIPRPTDVNENAYAAPTEMPPGRYLEFGIVEFAVPNFNGEDKGFGVGEFFRLFEECTKFAQTKFLSWYHYDASLGIQQRF